MDPSLEKRLAETAIRWPKGKLGLEAELRRIARDHEENAIAWRRLGPLIALLCLSIVWLIFMR